MARRLVLLAATGMALAVLTVAASSGFQMKPVTTIHARVSGDAPVWDAANDAFVASFGETFDHKYRATMDSVNTASVEGALMYVQAEGINQNEQSVPCERKNKMQYIVFYEITIAQPALAIAHYSYASSQGLREYCPFVALDGGKCTPEGPGDKLPQACELILGQSGQPKLGPCVGGEPRETDPRAPYPNTVWFSFPNSCLTKGWKDKTDECRQHQLGGLCPPGTEPDGVSCTFSSTILGYVSIDDVVGITSIPKTNGSSVYGNFTEFCLDGNVEFKATGQDVEEALPFWRDPFNATANAERAKTLVGVYNAKLNDAMRPLPTVDELTELNPPCYENSPACARAELGCRRHLYSQVCELCQASSDLVGCVAAPVTFVFPTLATEGSGSHETMASPSSDQEVGSSNSTHHTAKSSGSAQEKGPSDASGLKEVDRSPLATISPVSYDFSELTNTPTTTKNKTVVAVEAVNSKDGIRSSAETVRPHGFVVAAAVLWMVLVR